MSIYHTNTDFDFSKIHLAQPIVTANGSFFSKINVTSSDESLFIYTPKGITKQGIVTTKDKSYTDLLFTSSNTNLIQWISLLEERLQQLIYDKKDLWFATENIELDDIQNAFVPMIKIYKNTNYLLRSYIQQSKHQLKGEPLLVYNESEQPCSLSDISDQTNLITILEIQGIKFSQKSFHVPILIKQIMIFQKTSFNHILIKTLENSKEESTKDPIEMQPMHEKEKEEEQEEPIVQEQPKEIEISEINMDIDLNSLDNITLKNPLDTYNDLIKKMKESALQAKEAYSTAKDLKEQFNIEDELPIL